MLKVPSTKCIIRGRTGYGYELTGKRCESIQEAHRIAEENIENGSWYSYTLERI